MLRVILSIKGNWYGSDGGHISRLLLYGVFSNGFFTGKTTVILTTQIESGTGYKSLTVIQYHVDVLRDACRVFLLKKKVDVRMECAACKR